MDFVCVLSVYGSLVSYEISRHGENRFKAVAKGSNGVARDDIPQEFELEKKNNNWQATPWHSDIVPGITQCIDAAA